MHTSIHVSLVQVPHSGHYLLFQTLRGAVDLVSEEVAGALLDFESGGRSLSPAETETLSRRGYITDEAAEREREQARATVGLTARNLRTACEIVFRFRSSSQTGTPGRAETRGVEEVFSIWDETEIGVPRVAVVVEVAGAEIDAAMLGQILASATRRDYPIIPIVTPEGMAALLPWVLSQNFEFTTVQANSSDMPTDAGPLSDTILDYFERQVHVGMKCNVDGMNEDQLKAVSAVRDAVRRKYPFFVMLLNSSNANGTQEPDFVSFDGVRMPYISAENDGILGTLLRFISSPRSINYAPFFQPHPGKLILDIPTNRLSYEPPGTRAAVRDFDLVRETVKADFKQDSPMMREGESRGCLSCKYALVCGRNWIVDYGYRSPNECATALERRIRQVLPSLLNNIRGHVRPPGAKERESPK
ncbi:MAG TPA: hypothetical protein VJH03_23910 [Blastocatellia bacterium]|nr:hypothetical protein [Blastocatellia bacterium]